jgi:hypothetical protein
MDWEGIIAIAATLAIGLLSAFAAPWLKARAAAAGLDNAVAWAAKAVEAAELMFAGASNGADKKRLAVDFLVEALKADPNAASVLVEAAVYEMRQRQAAAQASDPDEMEERILD